MNKKKLFLPALLVAFIWVLASAVPVEAGRRSRYDGPRYHGHRSSVVTSFHAPYYAPFRGSHYYRPYHHRPYYRTYYRTFYRPYPWPYFFGYPYFGVPVVHGWPFFWPGVSFYFSF